MSTAEAALNRELACPNYVGGQWKASNSGRTLERRNPADLGELIGYASLSTREEVREAVAAAERAFPAWRQQPAPARGRILLNAARLLEEQKEDLAETAKLLEHTATNPLPAATPSHPKQLAKAVRGPRRACRGAGHE